MKDLGKSMNCDMSFQSQIKTAIGNMATYIRISHQIKKNLPSTRRLVIFKTLVLSHLEYPISLFTGLSKTQINFPDRQFKWGIETAFFRKKMEKSCDLKTKHQIMSFEIYLKNSCLSYLSRLPKGQIAFFIKSFMLPSMQVKHNMITLKLSSQIHTDAALIRNSFAFLTKKQWNKLSRNEGKQILETKQHKRLTKQLSLCSYINCEALEEHWKSCRLKSKKEKPY